MADSGAVPFAEGWFRERWNHLPTAVCVVAETSAGGLRIVEANARLVSMAGWGDSDGKLDGQPLEVILPRVTAGDLKLAREATGGRDAKLRTHLRCADGGEIPVWVDASEPYALDGERLIVAEVRNALRERVMEERLEAKRWALRAYAAAAMTLVKAESSETLLQQICEAMTEDSPFVLASVAMVGAAPEYRVDIQAKAGPAIAYMEGIEISAAAGTERGIGPGGEAFRTRQSQIVADVATDPRYGPWRERALRHGIRCTLTVPFSIGESQNGLLGVYSSNANAFGPVVLEAFEHLAQEIGVGLHRLRQREQIEQDLLERASAQQRFVDTLTAAVGAIAGAVEAGDPFTAGHQKRVAKVACDIAREMGWGADELRGLEMAAMVHDIGKLAVPQEILNKPGRLTVEEFDLVKVHVDVSYRILKDIPFPWPVAEIAWQHHEKLDGSGYPQGLRGEAVLPGARILAVADIVESMACERPYRKALGIDVALGEVESLAAAGKLDGEVVRVCARMFREQGYELPRGSRGVSACGDARGDNERDGRQAWSGRSGEVSRSEEVIGWAGRFLKRISGHDFF